MLRCGNHVPTVTTVERSYFWYHSLKWCCWGNEIITLSVHHCRKYHLHYFTCTDKNGEEWKWKVCYLSSLCCLLFENQTWILTKSTLIFKSTTHHPKKDKENDNLHITMYAQKLCTILRTRFILQKSRIEYFMEISKLVLV